MSDAWHEYFIKMAFFVSTKSKDPSTKVGCILVGEDNQVLSTGFNGFPRGVREFDFRCEHEQFGIHSDDIKARWDRPMKYQWVEHAERNAIYNAARHGASLKNATAYLNWEPKPCADCARALIQVGVTSIVGPDIPFGGKGANKFYDINDISPMMLNEAGVKRVVLPGFEGAVVCK